VKRIVMVAASLLAVGCGEKKAAEGSGAAAPDAAKVPVQAPAPDRIGAAPEPTVSASPSGAAKAKADTSKAAGPTVKPDDRGRDSAFGPKFMVDSTGKVTPIKKKP
jgi:hypothetical protein